MAQEWKKGTPLDDANQEKLRALVRREGLEKTAKVLDTSTVSVTRAAAGLGLRKGTILLIVNALIKVAA